ncbi:MAG: hypothetical protein SVT56_05345 [Chloroflexota bacterium]|jgi:ATP-dependent protease ClpP protease subunit|nr:hypothetical protein [Chloroflexota bacterium]
MSGEIKPKKEKFETSQIDEIPATYQGLMDLFGSFKEINLFEFRKETMKRIESKTERNLICYVTQITGNTRDIPTGIDDFDLTGFNDLVSTSLGEEIDILIISNGGSPEATERIVKLIRSKYNSVRYIVPSNAYSAATLISFSGDQLIMGPISTLGPIDPQIGGIPARAIIRAFDRVEERLKTEGPKSLTAYLPLLQKYDLHLLEMCESAQKLSEELAKEWLSKYLLKSSNSPDQLHEIVKYFSSFDKHKSHARGIDRETAKSQGLPIVYTEEIELDELVGSLLNQYMIAIDRSPFYKLFENSRGINWGRQRQNLRLRLPNPEPQQPDTPNS